VEIETGQVDTYYPAMTKTVRKTNYQHDLTRLALTAGSSRFEAAVALIAQTHARDAQDVQAGRIAAEQLGFFSREFVKSLKLHFPEDRVTSR